MVHITTDCIYLDKKHQAARTAAKTLFIRLCYGGHYDAWAAVISVFSVNNHLSNWEKWKVYYCLIQQNMNLYNHVMSTI